MRRHARAGFQMQRLEGVLVAFDPSRSSEQMAVLASVRDDVISLGPTAVTIGD